MGQHYIPQYYLSGFCDPNNPSNVWVFQKGYKNPFTSTIKSAANENRRWPQEVETYLANQIETPANSVLDKIRNLKPITSEDREIFSGYLIVMLQRVDKGLERMKTIAPKLIDELFDNVKVDLERMIREQPAKTEKLSNSIAELPQIKASYTDKFPLDIWYQNIMPDSLPKIRTILPAMTWNFLVTNEYHPFLTNDNPVFFFEDIGIGKINSEITFPVSRNVTLWTSWKNDRKDEYINVKKEVVIEINRRVARNASRWVYAPENATWISALINRKNIGLKIGLKCLL